MAKTILKDAVKRRKRITEAMVLADTLTEQLRMAGLVQRDFLPSQFPECPKLRWATTFLPAEWVSGDIYDIARIDENHIGFYVADVVGHGIPAALLTIFVKQALVMRQTAGNSYHVFSPAEVMKNLNLRMIEQEFSGFQFITCCYCLLNINSLELTYSRAGHPYPVLIRDRQTPQQLESHGSLLGVFDRAEFSQQTIQLQPKDKFLLYSDGAEPFFGGFSEARGFSYSREFCEIKDLPLDKMTERFSQLVQNRKSASGETDDITLLGLEILQND
jgi:sigma-B regulation protein RsbU (phosphoserine phosphatase)